MAAEYGLLIGGVKVDAADGYDVVNPATEQVVGVAPNASVEQAQAACAAAREAFDGWARTPMAERCAVLARIAALRPGHYTRLGAAIRHASHRLAARARQRRLLLVITDGKPNDLDHYEGRYGLEDSAWAVREARRAGHAVFGITIDRKAQAYFPVLFGRNAFAILRHGEGLTAALPLIWRHIVP